MIVDFHTHIFPPEIIARRAEFAVRDPWFGEIYGDARAKMATADDLAESMVAAGVDLSLAFPFGWSDQGIAEECNSYVLQAMRDYPGRILGLAAVQPLEGARAIAEIERCARGGMPGIGELMPHGQGYRLSDTALLAPIVEAVEALGLFLLTHTSEPVGHLYRGKGDVVPADFQTFVAAFPRLRVVAAHWGGGFPFYELMPEVRAAAANVWYDSSASLFLYRAEIFPTVARIAGAHKLLWASDFPLISQQRMLAYVQDTELSPDELRLALGRNAQTLLGIAGPDSGLASVP
jgi:predicted TIM-barrel fold metal-dependent hydrolase